MENGFFGPLNSDGFLPSGQTIVVPVTFFCCSYWCTASVQMTHRLHILHVVELSDVGCNYLWTTAAARFRIDEFWTSRNWVSLPNQAVILSILFFDRIFPAMNIWLKGCEHVPTDVINGNCCQTVGTRWTAGQFNGRKLDSDGEEMRN